MKCTDMDVKSDCSGSSCCDSQSDCGCKCHSCECCQMSKEKMMFMMMVDLADEAYMKLAKQKMMDVFEKKMGQQMNKSAEFFVEQSIMKWMDEEKWSNQLPSSMEAFAKSMAQNKK